MGILNFYRKNLILIIILLLGANELPRRKSKKEEQNSDSSSSLMDEQLKKLEVIEKIEILKRRAQENKLSNNYDEAIIIADKIMRLSIEQNLSDYMEEQVNFIKEISRKVQKDHLVSQIKEYAIWILNQYDKLITSGAYYQAHDIVERFKESFEGISYFHELKEVQEVLKKDQKEWLKFSLENQ